MGSLFCDAIFVLVEDDIKVCLAFASRLEKVRSIQKIIA